MKENNKNKKVVKAVVLIILMLGIIASFIYYSKIFGEDSIFNKNIVSNNFVNKCYKKIPALIISVEVVVITILINIIIKFLLNKLFTKTNRGKTIVRLLESFIKYLLAIIALLVILSKWGVDTATLLASAGILTLIIGLGAQSLVADIVAGVFIVFEGEYQVGDIVVIDDWRGTVKEIGIRTTKIVDAGGNIKIVNNSEITSIINQTQELSLAKCTMYIHYDESLERTELIIRDHLSELRDKIPQIVEGPFYKGISDIGDSNLDMLFIARCREEDLYQVQRDLRRELIILFADYNIEMSYNQIVVNPKDEIEQNKPYTSPISKEEAQAFMDKQKELTKHIREDDNNNR